jgi:ribonucleoside-diphosphate reductase alpha chain
MSTAVKIETRDARSIPYQEASLDIWDKKYRLTAKDGSPIDHVMDDRQARRPRSPTSRPERELERALPVSVRRG